MRSARLEVADASLFGADIRSDSLFGSDVFEPSLTPLDGHDSFDSECDPGSTVYIVCDELTFYARAIDGDQRDFRLRVWH